MADVNDLREKAEAAAKADTPWPEAVNEGLFYAQQHALRWHPGITLAALRVIEAAEAVVHEAGPEVAPTKLDYLITKLAATLRDFREAK